MIKAGLIHFDPKLAEMHYNHQNMKRTGGTTILKHLIFESRIFQFGKTPNGRIQMLGKEAMKKLLKGMSPDLTDNIILMCGSKAYDCYRILRDDTGVMRQTLAASDMLNLLHIGEVEEKADSRVIKKEITVNDDWILQAFSI